MKEAFGYIFLAGLGITLIYGLWLGGKWINYKLAYESGVETTVKEMVKPECLQVKP